MESVLKSSDPSSFSSPWSFCHSSSWGFIPVSANGGTRHSLWFTAVTVLLAHTAYRQYAPFSSSQDFRYSMISIVPFAYFLLAGIEGCSKPVRIGCYVLLTLLLVGNVIFIAGLPFLQK